MNIVNKFGETALQIAKTKDHLKCIGALVQAGAVVNDDGRLSGKNKMYPHTATQGQRDEFNSGGPATIMLGQRLLFNQLHRLFPT